MHIILICYMLIFSNISLYFSLFCYVHFVYFEFYFSMVLFSQSIVPKNLRDAYTQGGQGHVFKFIDEGIVCILQRYSIFYQLSIIQCIYRFLLFCRDSSLHSRTFYVYLLLSMTPFFYSLYRRHLRKLNI